MKNHMKSFKILGFALLCLSLTQGFHLSGVSGAGATVQASSSPTPSSQATLSALLLNFNANFAKENGLILGHSQATGCTLV